MNSLDVSRFFDRKRVLITGAAGFIATKVIDLLCHSESHIICISHSTGAAQFPPGIAQIEHIFADIRDPEIWEKYLEGIDFVFHFAAQTSVYWANENPLEDLEINVTPMVRLLETCRQKGWAPVVLFSGTVTEVGLPVSLPVNENHPDLPITIYDLHKWMAEIYLKYYTRQNFVRGVVLRLANVYGPGPGSSSADRGVLNKMIRKALNGEPLTVFGEGNYLRDYLYIEDVAHAFLEAGAHAETLSGEHFVLGSGQGHTLSESFNLVSERVALKTGHRVPVVHIEPPAPQSPIEARNFVADSSKFAHATGWQANFPLFLGIDRTIEYYLPLLNTISRS